MASQRVMTGAGMRLVGRDPDFLHFEIDLRAAPPRGGARRAPDRATSGGSPRLRRTLPADEPPRRGHRRGRQGLGPQSPGHPHARGWASPVVCVRDAGHGAGGDRAQVWPPEDHRVDGADTRRARVVTSSSLAPMGGPVASMDEAIARMKQIDAALPAADGLACFNRMYLDVTQQVQAQVTAGLLCRRRLSGPSGRRLRQPLLRGGRRRWSGQPANLPAAWAPLLETRADPRHLPDPVRPGRHERPHQPRPAHRSWSRPAPTWTPPPTRAAITPTTRRSTPSSTRAEQSVRQSFESQAVRRRRPAGPGGSQPGLQLEHQLGPRRGVGHGPRPVGGT